MGKDTKKKETTAKPVKKEITPLDKLVKTFLDDYNDNELQNRYDGMVTKEKRARDNYNELLPRINDLLNRQAVLKYMIIESAKMGFLNAEATQQLIEIDKQLDETRDTADIWKRDSEHEAELIERYKTATSNKLFIYWKAIKAVDSTIVPWMDWKVPYENKIF